MLQSEISAFVHRDCFLQIELLDSVYNGKGQSMHSFCFRVGAALALLALGVHSVKAQGPGEEQIVRMLQQDQPYHAVSPEQFEQLGWGLPDGGSQVKALADAVREGGLQV